MTRWDQPYSLAKPTVPHKSPAWRRRRAAAARVEGEREKLDAKGLGEEQWHRGGGDARHDGHEDPGQADDEEPPQAPSAPPGPAQERAAVKMSAGEGGEQQWLPHLPVERYAPVVLGEEQLEPAEQAAEERDALNAPPALLDRRGGAPPRSRLSAIAALLQEHEHADHGQDPAAEEDEVGRDQSVTSWP